MKPKFGFRRICQSDKMTGYELDERVRQIDDYRAAQKLKKEERQREKGRLRQEYMARFSPCPFCLSQNLMYQYSGDKTGWVCCCDCDATGPCSDGEDEAIENWNRRPTPSGESHE